MMRRRNQQADPPPLRAATLTLLLAAVVVCLALLGVLCLATARADLALAERQLNSAYDTAAAELLGAQWYREAYPGVDPVVVTNAPTGADGVIDLRARLGIPEEALLYLHSGYLAPGRNIPLILRAFEQVTRAHVVFVGSGALLPEVERAAASHPNIHHLPPVQPEQVLAMTRGADVALCLIESGCLSHRMSTPNKMMEAFAAGVPALCSPLAEARRYLGDQAPAWVLEDPERDLASALRHITRDDIDAFEAPRIPTWEEGAARLRKAYERALAAQATHQ